MKTVADVLYDRLNDGIMNGRLMKAIYKGGDVRTFWPLVWDIDGPRRYLICYQTKRGYRGQKTDFTCLGFRRWNIEHLIGVEPQNESLTAGVAYDIFTRMRYPSTGSGMEAIRSYLTFGTPAERLELEKEYLALAPNPTVNAQ